MESSQGYKLKDGFFLGISRDSEENICSKKCPLNILRNLKLLKVGFGDLNKLIKK